MNIQFHLTCSTLLEKTAKTLPADPNGYFPSPEQICLCKQASKARVAAGRAGPGRPGTSLSAHVVRTQAPFNLGMHSHPLVNMEQSVGMSVVRPSIVVFSKRCRIWTGRILLTMSGARNAQQENRHDSCGCGYGLARPPPSLFCHQRHQTQQAGRLPGWLPACVPAVASLRTRTPIGPSFVGAFAASRLSPAVALPRESERRVACERNCKRPNEKNHFDPRQCQIIDRKVGGVNGLR